jgi:hypothetical protein
VVGGGGLAQHVHLASGEIRVAREWARQGSLPLQLRGEHCDAIVLGQCAVVVVDAGDAEQLGDYLLVHGRVLPHVESAQMRAEDLDAPTHRLDLDLGQQTGAVRAE